MLNVTVTLKVSIGPTAELIIPVGLTPEQWREIAPIEENAPVEIPLQSSTIFPGTVLSLDF